MIRFESHGREPSDPPRWLVAPLLYLCALLLLVLAAFYLGVSSVACPEDASDCDPGGLAGLVWAFFAFWLGILAIIANECRLALRRRDRRLR